ncbi:hypothetical protein RclHR1_02400022 [Rhizophagus clarus]|uniref:Protein kinase domain-containing protein n=1 Tax=Rhizophagus clarus TaxID=94130 RepID=A0A2Z6RRA4_9GLOM|nr:hypothetical protein RclHR1_02400022 [Rhizophagus clarus]
MFHNESIFKDFRDFTKKNEEVRNLFTSNCKPTTAHFNIVQRVTAGLSFLHKEILTKRKLEIELKKQTSSSWKTTYTVSLQEPKTTSIVWQQSCEIPKSSIHWNIKDNGHAGTSRHRSDDVPEIASQLILARRYRVIKIVGEGAFSKTVCAEDLYRNGSLVAIKIMVSQYNHIGFEECKKLRYLNLHDIYENTHVIKLLNTFLYDKHFCLVFEYYRGGVLKVPCMINEQFRLQIVRKLACQLLTALIYIKHMAIIHGDLKLENILFVTENSYELRVIDFGNAIGLDDVKYYTESFEIQSLLYRAPEVLLGLPFGYEIDMWSFGCILCEIWTGYPIFQSDTKSGMIKEMERLLGPLPISPYKNAKNFAWYLTRNDNGLKDWPVEASKDTLRSMRIRKLSKALNTNNMDFVKFVDEIFNYDSSKRLSPTEALCHTFLAPLFPFTLFYTSHTINSFLKKSSMYQALT